MEDTFSAATANFNGETLSQNRKRVWKCLWSHQWFSTILMSDGEYLYDVPWRNQVINFFSEQHTQDICYGKVVSEFCITKFSYCRVLTQLQKCRLDQNLEQDILSCSGSTFTLKIKSVNFIYGFGIYFKFCINSKKIVFNKQRNSNKDQGVKYSSTHTCRLKK